MAFGLEADFAELMTSTISVYKYAGTNQWAEDTYSAVAAIYPAMVVRATKQIRTKNNQVKVSNAQVYLMGDYQIQPNDQIQLPDGTKPVILHIGAWSDDRGPYTQCVYT